MDDLAPSQIASALNKTVAEVNRSISDLTAQGLLDMKTIELVVKSKWFLMRVLFWHYWIN